MIAKIRCPIKHPLHLIVPPVRYSKLRKDNPNIVPASATSLKQELNTLAYFGVPTYLDTWSDGDLRINFCTQRYELGCGLTPQGDGFRVGHIIPLTFRRHNQIARQSVLVTTSKWFLHGENADLKRYLRDTGTAPQSGIKRIKAAWSEAERLSGQNTEHSVDVSLEHKRFLATVDSLIELARQVQLDEAARRSSTAVLGVEAVTQRSSAGRQYKFLLAAPSDLTVGDYVLAGIGEPGQHGGEYVGVVREEMPEALIVHFYQAVDWARLQEVEWLTPFSSQKQYDIQSQAVQALREGKAENKYLMQFIVDGCFQPYRVPDAPILSKVQLNQAQQQVIARAEAVPDVLLVLGPPGTGKTHTIRQIVSQQAQRKKRVLVTSKNNKAVDNVLEALSGVRAIRIGREEKIADAIRPLLIDEQAQMLQAEILAKTEPLLTTLQDIVALWPQIEHILERISPCIAQWQEAEAQLAHMRHQIALWQKSEYARIERVITKQQQRLQDTTIHLTQYVDQSRHLSARLNRLKPFCQLPLLGSAFVVWADRIYADWKQGMQAYRNCLREREKIVNQRQQVWQAYVQHVTISDEALRQKRLVAAAETELENQKQRMSDLLNELSHISARLQNSGLPTLPETAVSPQEILAVCERLQSWHQTVLAKKELLSEWRELLKRRRRALYPSLIKTADVIGATCIGIATDANFSDLDFEMVIADEAGQIQVMDLLVPLVRAKRAVLVGDDRQLPPVVDEEVARQIDSEDVEQRAWLATSLFERLFNETTPDSHKSMLDTQYRMPRIIADFISQQFYDNKYRTGKDVPFADPFFRSPIVFIDTQYEKNRSEQPAIEPEGNRGYINYLEARLIADVVVAYQSHGDEWGVIVPYKKQAERIQAELKRRRSGLPETLLKDWVATVDSFQGKERSVIIFGFTRSNTHGRIGFLSELRRLNVSLTRAKQQLVLIGNAAALTQSTDDPFAEFMKALVQITQSLPGGYFHARELKKRLGTTR